ncbi:Molybdopterin synthase catalytic subunit [Sarcoptes scabiei]|uniref:Molybdopterin synthase catalytic subunit n=1 Tax=Sarcoptes scabiei TaxID=52283 RepID=A0A834VCM9_SARSC|nr:Molybdopterin synthase catalytic subunit [Sarcoptes scabiei]
MENLSITLTSKQINVQHALDFIQSNDCGAQSIFIGTTRSNEIDDTTNKTIVQFLFYEAYEKMAIKLMNEIVKDQLKIPLGEASIVIAVSSPHRDGHQVVMNILNEIKKKVPIWKRVHFENDEEDWSSNSEAFWLN